MIAPGDDPVLAPPEVDAAVQPADPARRRPAVVAWLDAVVRHPVRIAFCLALLGGLAIAVLTPPFTGGDERDHFTRAYQISTGDVLTHRHGDRYGAFLPRTLTTGLDVVAADSYLNADRTAFLAHLGDPAPHGPPTFVSLANAASYGPGAYAVDAVAIDAGRVAGLSVLGLLYLARFAGVVAYAGVLALAVRRLPAGRWVLVACGLIPAALNQASTVSADGVTMALSFLVVAEAVRLAVDPPVRGLLIETGAAAGVLALAKPPYVAFSLLLLWPAWRHRAAAGRALAGIAPGALVLGALWGAYQATHSISQADPRLWLVGVDHGYAFHNLAAGRQTVHVVTHPFAFAAAIARTVAHQGFTMPGQLFGQLATYQLPGALVAASVAVVVGAWAVAGEAEEPTLDGRLRLLMVALTLAIAVTIFAIAYTNWNAYRAPRIDALPPRYFLPLLPALLIGARPGHRAWRLGGPPVRAVVGVGAVAVLAAALVGLVHYHFAVPPPQL